MRRDRSNEKTHHDCSNENPLEGETEEVRELLKKIQAIQRILGKNDKTLNPGKKT